MKVIVKGQGPVTLNQSHFKAMGGQASVYIKDGQAYKIYTDPKDTIPEAKFTELSVIQDPYVIKPKHMLLDERNNPIGYVMDTVPDSASLCQLFTKSFRTRNKIDNQMIINLISNSQRNINNIHSAGCLIVDLNENNELVSNDFIHSYWLDVDSYQTRSYRATVLNPSVRDYSVSSTNFSVDSDWFSWAVLAFQLFIGIHPYKGTYSKLDNIDKDAKLEQRMRQNISAFRKEVGLPGCCYTFDVIPQHYKDWLFAVLEEGKRCAPPDPTTTAAVVIQAVKRVVQFISGALITTELFDLEGLGLVDYSDNNSLPLILLSNGNNKSKIVHGTRIVFYDELPGTTLVGFTPQLNEPIAVNLYNKKVTILNINKKTRQTLDVDALEIAKSDDRFYIRTPSNIIELIFRETSSNTLITYHPVASVLEHATRLFEGVAIQNIVGSVFVSLFTKSRQGIQVRIPELDGYNIVEAKYSGGILMTLIYKNGKYHRQVFRFEDDVYDYRVINDITPVGINFITLQNGICLTLTEEEKLEAFPVKKGANGVKVIEDQAIGADMKLLVVKCKAGFERGGKIFSCQLQSGK